MTDIYFRQKRQTGKGGTDSLTMTDIVVIGSTFDGQYSQEHVDQSAVRLVLNVSKYNIQHVLIFIVKGLVGVALVMNITEYRSCVPPPSTNNMVHSGFEIMKRHQHKSKYGPPKIFNYNKTLNYLLELASICHCIVTP